MLASIPNIGTKLVDLPEELLNEPYAYVDNTYRPEFIVHRPKFLFEAGDRYARVHIAGKEVVEERHMRKRRVPTKNTSNFSVLNVYDTYGIDVAYVFLTHLYRRIEDKCSTWILVYLSGSYHHMTGNIIDFNLEQVDTASYICVTILLELMRRENEKFKLGYPIVPLNAPIPAEVIAIITGSERISKEVSRNVRAIKCSDIPTIEEAFQYTSGRHVTMLEDGSLYALDVEHAWSMLMYRDGDLFDVDVHRAEHVGSLPAYAEIDAPVVAESLYSYASVFVGRGCDVNVSINHLLDSLSRLYTVTDDNIEEVCAWVVQLSMDSQTWREGTYTMEELGDELRRLVEVCRGDFV